MARNCSGKGEALWSNFRLPVGDSPRHLCQHPASTPCVNSRSQHPASTPCVNTVLFPGPTTKEILNFLCSRGPLQRKSSISFVPRAHYKGNLQFPLFPGPTTKEIFDFLCSQRPTGLQAIWKVARNCPGKGGASGSIIGCVFRPFGVRNPSSIKNCPFTLRQQQMISKK